MMVGSSVVQLITRHSFEARQCLPTGPNATKTESKEGLPTKQCDGSRGENAALHAS